MTSRLTLPRQPRDHNETERLRHARSSTTQGNGTPIFLVPRDNGGLLLAQGRSHVLLSAAELRQLVEYAQAPQTTTPAKARLGQPRPRLDGANGATEGSRRTPAPSTRRDVRIASKIGDACLAVNPRDNGGIAIVQGPHHIRVDEGANG